MTETDVCSLYREMLEKATCGLKELPVFCGKEPVFSGLGGWVFEQTVRKCIRDSLASRGADLAVEEQVSL